MRNAPAMLKLHLTWEALLLLKTRREDGPLYIQARDSGFRHNSWLDVAIALDDCWEVQ